MSQCPTVVATPQTVPATPVAWDILEATPYMLRAVSTVNASQELPSVQLPASQLKRRLDLLSDEAVRHTCCSSLVCLFTKVMS